MRSERRRSRSRKGLERRQERQQRRRQEERGEGWERRRIYKGWSGEEGTYIFTLNEMNDMDK